MQAQVTTLSENAKSLEEVQRMIRRETARTESAISQRLECERERDALKVTNQKLLTKKADYKERLKKAAKAADTAGSEATRQLLVTPGSAPPAVHSPRRALHCIASLRPL